MASLLRSWLYAQNPTTVVVEKEASETSWSPPAEDDDDTETVHGDDEPKHDDDAPPAFPAANSAQRAASDSPVQAVPQILTEAQLMPPPPAPSLATRRPGVFAGSSSSAFSSSLLVPTTTTKPPAQPAKRGKVALAPGHGPLDWANLKKSGQDLRGTDSPLPLRVTLSMLKAHRTREDAWSCFNGKVYNITSYLPYHPGGEKEIMRVAGRDGTKLFQSTHAWVNVDYMLDECLIGFMVSESAS